MSEKQQQKIQYREIMDLGFNEEIENDGVYFNEFGYPWAIITLDLTKRIYLNWDKETQLCQLVRIDSPKTCNIKAKKPVRDLEQLKEIIEFFKNEK